MPKRSLIPALAMVASTVAACFGSPGSSPSLAPSPSVETTALPTSTIAAPPPSPSAKPVFTLPPQPAEGCTSIDNLDLTGIEVDLSSVDANGNSYGGGISVGRAGAFVEMTRITEVSGQQRSVVPPPQDRPRDRGQILGGHDFVAYPSTWFDGHVNPQAMISANATLELDGEAPLDLATRVIPGNVNFDQIAVTVPDVSGRGVLSMSLVWVDPCFRYEGSLSNEVDVVPLSATAGCALETRPYYEQIAALLNGSLAVGSTAVHAFSPRNESKFSTQSNPGIDAFILYAFDRDEPAIVAAPGEVLRVKQLSSDITVDNEMAITLMTRASVAKAIKDYPPIGVVTVSSKTGTLQSDGTFRLRVPQDSGRYVAAFTTTYDSRCSSGDLWFIVNIDVVVPTVSATPPPSESTAP